MWFLEALFFAFWTGISVFFVKNLSKKIPSSSLLLLLTFVFTLPWMVVLIFLTGGFPSVSLNFFKFISVSAILDIIAFSSYFLAIKNSDISVIGPLSSFGPLFTTLFAVIFLHEVPSPFNLLGIMLIVMGSYFLDSKNIKGGFFSSLLGFFKNKYVLLAILATFLWSITPIFQKNAINETYPQQPIAASFVGMLFITTYFLITNFSKISKYKNEVKNNLSILILFGLGSSIAQFAAFSAFASAPLGPVVALMRLSGLFTVLLGGLLLKEKNINYRLIGALVMLAGSLFLLL